MDVSAGELLSIFHGKPQIIEGSVAVQGDMHPCERYRALERVQCFRQFGIHHHPFGEFRVFGDNRANCHLKGV